MKSKVKLNTVNVIEMTDSDTIDIRSFTDDKKGNAAAEKVFRACLLENGCPPDDVDSYIEDGYFARMSYTLFLVHSS